ncbi:MAG: DsrE family protein [Rhodospirillales bacterium]|nr:DsrE family protein [Rhodospirillales bacterium]
MKNAIVVLFLVVLTALDAPSPAWATMAEPQPSFDHPRQIVMSLSEKDETRVNAVLNNVANVQKAYGVDHVKLAVVAYGPGIWSLLQDSPVRARIESLMKYDVEFVACGNTLDSIHKTDADLIDGTTKVQTGLVEIVERRLSGWVDIKP